MSVANPEHLDCAYCPYIGRPDEQIVHELHAAREALFRIHHTRRQLSIGQRRAIARAQSQRQTAFVLLGLMLVPLVLCGGGCGAMLFLENDGLVLGDVFWVILAVLPTGMVLAAGWLLMRWHRKAIERLMRSCAAVPPAAQGRPAMCHVCGGPLHEAERYPVVRCTYCHADNITSSDVMESVARSQSAVVNQLASTVAGEASRVSKSTSTALTLAFVFALLSPLIAFGIGFVVLLVFAMTPTNTKPDELYAYVDIAGTRCYGSFRKNDKGYTLNFGDPFPELTGALEVGPHGVYTTRAADLVGKRVLAPGDRPLTVRKLVRSLLDETNKLDAGEAPATLSPIGLCEAPPNLQELADNDRLSQCSGIYIAGGSPYVVDSMNNVFRVDLPSKQVAEVYSFSAAGPTFFDGKALLRLLPSGWVWSIDLNDSPVTGRGIFQKVDLFALSGTRPVMVSTMQLWLKDASGELKAIHEFKTKPLALAANDTHVFWSDEAGVMSLPLAGGEPVKLHPRIYSSATLTPLGDYLMVRGSSCLWLRATDGEPSECPYTGPLFSEYPTPPLSDEDHGYLLPQTTNRRQGIHGFEIAEVPTFDRHYAPASEKVTCMGLDEKYVYWVEGNRLLRDIKAQK
ncbi:MAG: hypothetical protein R3B89_32255 [Polyangiaceae bacterium]